MDAWEVVLGFVLELPESVWQPLLLGMVPVFAVGGGGKADGAKLCRKGSVGAVLSSTP